MICFSFAEVSIAQFCNLTGNLFHVPPFDILTIAVGTISMGDHSLAL